MVCDNNGKLPLSFEERCEILGIGPARAKFLMACEFHKKDKVQPYDESVLVREAFRLGIGFRDTADMMGFTDEKLASFGVPFPRHSAYPPPPGPQKTYNLFAPEPTDPVRCRN
jgi:hypothetical protein